MEGLLNYIQELHREEGLKCSDNWYISEKNPDTEQAEFTIGRQDGSTLTGNVLAFGIAREPAPVYTTGNVPRRGVYFLIELPEDAEVSGDDSIDIVWKTPTCRITSSTHSGCRIVLRRGTHALIVMPKIRREPLCIEYPMGRGSCSYA